MPVASACRGLHACGAGCGAALAVSLLCARSGAAVAPLVESAGQPAARAVVDDVEVLILLSGARHMRSQWPQQREFVQEAAASLQAAMDDVIERCFSDTYDHAPAGDAVECVGGDVRVATALYNTEGVHQLHPLIDASMVDDAGLSAAFEKAGGEGLYASFGAWHPALRACGETLRATELGGPPRRRFCLFVADPQADACEDRVDNDADDPCKEFPDLCPDESDTGGEVLEMTSDLAACSKYVSNGQLVDIREGDAGALTGIHLLLALTAEQVQLNSNPHLREFLTRATNCSFHEDVHEVDVPAGEKIVTDWVLDSSCNSFSMRRDLARLSGAAPPTFAAALRGAVAWTLPPAPDAVPTPAPTPAAPPTAAPAPAAPAPAPRPEHQNRALVAVGVVAVVALLTLGAFSCFQRANAAREPLAPQQQQAVQLAEAGRL